MTGSKKTSQTKAREAPKTATPLFRAQASAHKRRTLYGEVVLVANPALWLISTGLVLATGILLGLAFFAPIFGTPDIDSVIGQTFWQWLRQEPG